MTRDRVLRRSRPFAAAASLLLLPLLAGLATADPPPAAGSETYSPFNGKVTYRVYCLNCHGPAAKGDGYLADSLKVRPTDLTVLAKENGGVFPEARVIAAIDGREQVKEHGLREMPVWGDAFLWPEDSAEQRAKADRKLHELVEFVRTIQVAGETK